MSPHPSARPLRASVLNDYPVVVSGVAAMLAPYAERVAVEPAAWPELPTGLDVLLYDTYATLGPDEDEVYAQLRRSPTRLVVYSWAYDARLVQRALSRGADGYLSKRLAPDQLVGALELVVGGETVTPGRERLLDPTEHGDWPGRGHELSARESEVVALIAKGLSNDEIAERLYLSINSVKTYVRTAYRKMGVGNRSQAMLWAMAHGFASAPRPTAQPRVEPSPASSAESPPGSSSESSSEPSSRVPGA